MTGFFVSLNEPCNMAWKQRVDPKEEGPTSLGYLPAQQLKVKEKGEKN